MINMFEGIDTNKTKESRKCIIRNYYYFLKLNIRFQPKTCENMVVMI